MATCLERLSVLAAQISPAQNHLFRGDYADQWRLHNGIACDSCCR